jgi:glycogen debranching enzyme
LKERFNRDFWLDDDGYVAFGLDAEKRPIRALTSNGAHCLPTGIVRSDHIPRLVRRLFEPDLFSGWGIRTLSSRNPAYNPLDYHLGSVWPVENATILFGLRRYGFNERTYPRANAPQTWNQSVFVIMVQSLLGLVPYAPLRLLLVDPVLPPWLPEITVKRLRIGGATLTLRFQRDASGDSHFEVVEQNGALRIMRQSWVESFSADLWQRASGVFESVLSRGG